jgi:hypothetical protein
MRFLALALTFSLAACDSPDTMNGFKPDLSVTTVDMAMGDANQNIATDLQMPDLGPLTPSGMIQQVINAANGAMNANDGGLVLSMALPVEDVFVTYLRPAVAGQQFDPAGFFVQAEPAGPALFVAVDPAATSPTLAVGDKVSFTVTAVDLDTGFHEATQITGLARSTSGNSLASFVQDLTNVADIVSMVGNYESELSKETMTITGNFSSSGPGYVAANATTPAVTNQGGKLKVRLPAGVRADLNVTNGCVIAIGPTPFYRFNANAEPSAWLDGDLSVVSCPAPQVINARATDATHVVVTFDRGLDMSTVVAGNFAIVDGGASPLTVSAAALTAPTQVTLTTASQVAGTLYTLTVTGVKDTAMTLVDPAHDSALFHGFGPSATVIINEFTPGITGGFDLLELKATAGGSVSGFTLQQGIGNPTILATLPDQVVATNDFIVLHIVPSPSPAPSNEIATKTDCAAPSCYGTAWDALGVAEIGNSGRVLTVRDPSNSIQDGVAFYNKTADATAAFVAEMQLLHDAGFWKCAAATCVAADAARSNGAGNNPGGKSVKRATNNVPAGATGGTPDWPTTNLTNSTYGAP